MNWLRRSLFRRLLVSNLLPILLGFGAMGVIISLSISQYLTDKSEQEMLQQAKSVNVLIRDMVLTREEMKEQLIFLGEAFNKRIMVFDNKGKIIGSSAVDEVHFGKEVDMALVEQVMQGEDIVENISFQEIASPVLSVIVPWGKEDQIYGGILVDAPVVGVSSTFRSIREIVLWSLILGSFISAFLVSLLSWSISRPLKRIEYAATEIALGHYDKRVDYPYFDEIGELTNAFNRMAEKLNEIEQHRQELEQKRDDFIANISHELRTPLTAMQGFIEALQDGLIKDEASKQKYYEVMYYEVHYINRLVNDLMDLIKLKNKKIRLDLYYVKIEEVIKKVELTLEGKFKEQRNQFSLAYPEQLPTLLADATRLEQIFMNLLENANKFTENGEIHVDIKVHRQVIYIDVVDNGRGIASHDLNQIWDRFFKLYPKGDKAERGSGLGLAIVKELVELHKGKITVQSQLGKGTTFTILLPILSDHEVMDENS